ncbi:MAG: FliH/SctL family protein [Candidatus Tyrphobacter sp.]
MDEFVPLDAYLQVSERAQELAAAPEPAQPQVARQALQEARRFRAALADAFDAAREQLVRDLASDVLARELACTPADVRRIAQRTLARYAGDEPLHVCVHPGEVALLAGFDLPVVADARLRRGDVTLVLRHGTIDASLGVRLAHLLQTA